MTNRSTCGAIAITFLLAAATSATAQTLLASSSLPDAPSAVQAQQDTPGEQPRGTATVYGIVSDIRGGLVPGASVRLKEKNVGGPRDIVSDAEGRFNFDSVGPGTYFVIISAPGLEKFRSGDFVIKPGERYELPEIALPIATASTSVDVVADSAEVAEQELKLETQQRVIGIFPNFYTSFLWNAAPLNTKQKFKLSLKRTTDPVVFITTGIVAAVEQANNTFPGFGDDAASYGKRYGAAFGDAFIGRTLGAAVFPSIFRQDPRYFYMGPNHSLRARFKHAVLAGIVARGDNGKWQPNYSHVFGNASAGAISAVYHPDENPGTLAGRNALIGIAGGGVEGLLREFIWPRFTHKVPSYATGKPKEQP